MPDLPSDRSGCEKYPAYTEGVSGNIAVSALAYPLSPAKKVAIISTAEPNRASRSNSVEQYTKRYIFDITQKLKKIVCRHNGWFPRTRSHNISGHGTCQLCAGFGNVIVTALRFRSQTI